MAARARRAKRDLEDPRSWDLPGNRATREARHRIGRFATLLACALLSAACPGAPHATEPPSTESEREWQRCEDPRPKLCLPGFDPVCAQRDTGIRCVTTPCDSSEERDYPSACQACRDAEVFSYSPGRC